MDNEIVPYHNMKSVTQFNMNMTNSDRKLWLVKVPKYIAKKWDKAPGDVTVGKLKVLSSNKNGAQYALELTDSILARKDPEDQDIPKHYTVNTSKIDSQTMGIFTTFLGAETSGNNNNVTEASEFSGVIVLRLDIRPNNDETYQKLKIEAIKRAQIPTSKLVQLDRAVVKFTPISNHKHNIEYDQKKKAEGKFMQEDKEIVHQKLFAAFEQHQYYTIKDLVQITRQPVGYLKDILKDICNYNMKNPHRNTWELKPEYRYYSNEEKTAS